jgi:hypothetical protein
LKTHYVLIDYENVRVTSLALLKNGEFRVWIFLGPDNAKLDKPLVLAMQGLGERGSYVPVTKRADNALDFHVTYYLGALAKEDPTGSFHIISKDTGYDPLIEHLRTGKISVSRSNSIEAMPCFSKKKEPKRSDAEPTDDQLLSAVITDLIKRKTARPSTLKTLLSTIQARCGTGVPASKAQAIRETLLSRGFVKMDGTKVVYSLPPETTGQAT